MTGDATRDPRTAVVEALTHEINVSGALVLEGAGRAAEAVVAVLESGRLPMVLLALGDLQGSVGAVLQVKREVEAERDAALGEVARLRAERFDPGPVVSESSMFGWVVNCGACSAGTLMVRDWAEGLRRAEQHHHAVEDADGFVDARGCWGGPSGASS